MTFRIRMAAPLRILAALGTLALGASPGRGQDARLRLESPSFPRPFLAAEQVDVVLEASGVEPIDGRRALVAHDKDPALHVVDLAAGRLVGAPITSPKFPAQTAKGGPKWEGMARDGEGNFYVIGSHSGKTDEEKAEKAALVRFRLKEGDAPAIDDASVVRWHLARSLESALRGLGLDDKKVAKRKIEGLAIREGDGRRELVVGLREPGDKVRAFAADITKAPAADAELELRPVFAFDAGAREGVPAQLTSLEYVPALGGFLVLTATEDEDNAFHGNTLWYVADGATDRAVEVATFEVAMKAEGLAVLDARREGRGAVVAKLLITFDNDPHATKIPSRFQTATLVLEPR